VWSKTVLFINFDENDGFFDHMPPPAAPSYETWNADPASAVLAGDSTVSLVGEQIHELRELSGKSGFTAGHARPRIPKKG